MTEFQNIMYASPHLIRQIFSERFGDASQVELGTIESRGSGVGGKLNLVIGKIGSEFKGQISDEEIHTINYDDEFVQVKRIVNELMGDKSIPQVSELTEGIESSLYRFSSEVMLKPSRNEFDDENDLEVRGVEGDVKFHGLTSFDNWGSRSNILNAIEAGKIHETYPFQGLLMPVAGEPGRVPGQSKFRVQYLFILGPDEDALDRWYSRKELVGDSFEEERESA